MGRAWSEVDSPSQRVVLSADTVALILEPAMATATCAVLLHPPSRLVMVTVNTVVSSMATVWVVGLLGSVTMLAGSQWKL